MNEVGIKTENGTHPQKTPVAERYLKSGYTVLPWKARQKGREDQSRASLLTAEEIGARVQRALSRAKYCRCVKNREDRYHNSFISVIYLPRVIFIFLSL